MKTKLIALVAIVAGAVASLSHDVAEGVEFEVDAADAESLITGGKAKPLAAASPPPAPAKKERQTKARVLYDCPHGKANDVVELPESVAKQAEKEGLVDTNKDAVAYASQLEQNRKPD